MNERTSGPSPSGESPRGWGGLVTTEVDRIALGTHHGRYLHARVERRTARLTAGRAWHVSLGLGRTRPVAIEVSGEVSGPGERYDLSITTTDPWMQAARRIAAVAVGAVAVLVIANRIRAQQEGRRDN